MAEKRPTNSELRLSRLEDDELPVDEERGILELFDTPAETPDEDAPMDRDRSE